MFMNLNMKDLPSNNLPLLLFSLSVSPRVEVTLQGLWHHTSEEWIHSAELSLLIPCVWQKKKAVFSCAVGVCACVCDAVLGLHSLFSP